MIERDPRVVGHAVHEIKGTMVGTCFRAETGRLMTGGSRSDGVARYEGILIGRTIVGQFVRVNAKGERIEGSFRLATSR